MLGCMALIISLSILEGFDKTLHNSAVKFTSHITVTSFNKEPLPDFPGTISKLKEKFPEIVSVEPVCEREGLIKSQELTEGISIRGIFPDMNVSGLKDFITEGKFGFSDSLAKEIIIGKRLADRLNVSLNQDIVVLTIKTSTLTGIPEPKAEKFKIVALYNSGMVQYDDILVFIPYYRGLKLLEMPDFSASNYQIMLSDMYDAPKLVDSVESFLRYPYFALTVFNYHGSIFSWIEIQKQPIPIVLGLISIVAVLNIITSLLITIVEKTNSIGILRALGLDNRKIISIFLIKGFGIGLKGTISGLGLAYLFCILQKNYGFIRLKGEIYFLDVLPVEIVAQHYIIVGIISMVLAVTATIIPAIIASKVTPLKAIQFK
jgi:lipoprotein-releasing system permease protein